MGGGPDALRLERTLELRPERWQQLSEDLGQPHGGVPWIVPSWLGTDDQFVREWEREMTAGGFDVPAAE